MEPALNCTLLPQCHLDTMLEPPQALGLLQELCHISRAPDVGHISAAVQGVLGSLLTCGFLLSTFFFIFTIRFRTNRIVKMSSPNLNLVIVLGSVFTYISAFMFAAAGHAVSMETVIQARVSLLYLGISLVFGPLLGKSWRLYRVFTHRVPDKRVIIKDMTLLGLEGVLLFVDSLLILSWVLLDPVICILNVSAGIKAADRSTSCEVTRTHFCSSKYPDIWIALLMGFKAMFLVFGSYLAGLTNNISTPPVNQSLVIMVGSSLVVVASGVSVVVSRVFYTWPSLVYGVTAGSILLCTTAINCLIFIPQVLQWKQFEDEPSQTNTQMAKYFNSPSKSMKSMYSEEQIYHLLGENTSMRRLLTEKNAVIESLQEQVTNAKEKLVELLKSECSVEITQVSAISASTLTINQLRVPTDETTAGAESQRPFTAKPQCCRPSTFNLESQRPSTANPESRRPFAANPQSQRPSTINAENRLPTTEDPDGDTNQSMVVRTAEEGLDEDAKPPAKESDNIQEVILPFPEQKQDHEVAAISRSVSFANDGAKSPKESIERSADGLPEAWEQLSRKVNYVSTEKLQEILRELSVETLSGCGQGSPRRQRRSSHSMQRDPIPPPEGFRNVCISLSPYIARRRRGHGYSHILPSSQYARAVFPPPRLIGIRDRYHGVNPLRDDLDGANHPSVTVKNVDLCGQENGGLWITRLSEEPEALQESFHTTPWTHPGPPVLSSESDSSSSEETLCYCHRPYCDMCSPPTCDSSDSCNTDTEVADQLQGWPGHHSGRRPGHHSGRRPVHRSSGQPVINFKDDLTPTFV
ncbi:probable G-protein coupled receptor 156 [Dendropsophus ebraccatus]|uniref:probable G-protein coupled receptor 156 n=1 Tax=Dendropsophus ebraccatus TaxID=150705 RepID=UPI00383134BA